MIAALSFPILERIPLFGDAAISPHGIGIAVGFLLGAMLMLDRAEKRGLGHLHVEDVREQVQEVLLRAALGALIGSRLFFVLTHLDRYLDDPLRILAVWEGGLTFLGGLTGAVLLALPMIRGRGWRPIQVLDSAAPGIALGLVIGRLGDLVIGDHIGPPAGDWPLAWSCSGNYWQEATNTFAHTPPQPYPLQAVTSGAIEPPTQGCFDIAVHQTALYDLVSVGTLLLVLLWAERKPRWDGFFVAAWVYWYGAFRFTSDFARQDRTWFALTGSQWALLSAAIGLTVFLVFRRPWEREPWAWNPPDFAHPWDTAVESDPGDAGPSVRPDAPDEGAEGVRSSHDGR